MGVVSCVVAPPAVPQNWRRCVRCCAQYDIVDHAWMGWRPAATSGEQLQERRLLAVTSNGIVLVFTKDGEGLLGDVAAVDSATGASDSGKDKASGFSLRTIIRCELPKDASGTPAQVKSLVTYNKGFALAGTGGLFIVYEKTDDKKEPFMHIKTFKQGDDVVTSMSVSPNDEALVAFSPQSLLRTFPLSLIDVLPLAKNNFQPLTARGVHTRGIVCTCL